MTPQIRLKDSTYARLQTWAEPWRDTQDDTVNRVLDAAEASGLRPVKGATEGVGKGTQKRTRRPDWHVTLGAAGYIRPGAEIRFLKPPEDASPDDPVYSATVGADGRRVRWQADGQEYSLSPLTEMLRARKLAPIHEGALNGALFWGLVGSEESLHSLASRVINEGEKSI